MKSLLILIVLILIIIGISVFIYTAVRVIQRKKQVKFKDETDPDSGLSDSWRLSDDREHHSAHSHDLGSDSGGGGD